VGGDERSEVRSEDERDWISEESREDPTMERLPTRVKAIAARRGGDWRWRASEVREERVSASATPEGGDE
jgi:hypothetical protein